MHRSILQKSDANSQLYVLVECLTIRQQERRDSRKILWIERKYWTAVPRLTVSRNEFRRFSANCESKGGNCCVSWYKWLNDHGTTVPPSTNLLVVQSQLSVHLVIRPIAHPLVAEISGEDLLIDLLGRATDINALNSPLRFLRYFVR